MTVCLLLCYSATRLLLTADNHLMAGRDACSTQARVGFVRFEEASGLPPAIVVDHLTRYYRAHQKEPGLLGSFKALVSRKEFDVRAVEDVSFAIAQGELVGFLGPNGAGKTTTLKVLAGLLHPTAGRVSVLGHTPWRREAAFQRQFALVMGQKSQLWWDLPALESLALNKEIYGVSDADYRRTLDDLTELLDLKGVLAIQVRKLSLGERMKCELAAALLHSPQVLFLDEPTIGLDIVMQQRIREFVREYNRRRKATIVLTSHYMADVKELCERVVVINKGHIVYDGGLAELTRHHADHKLLIAVFSESVQRQALAAIGEVVEHEPLRAVLLVPRAEVSPRAAQLLAAFPVADLAIQEPSVEDVIREVFSR